MHAMKCFLFALVITAASADDGDNNGDDNNQREEENDGSYFEWADYKSCASITWLNVYSDDAADCAATIISDELKNLCSRTSFIHAGHYDGNCGCITDGSVDCTLAENQVYDANVTLYAFGQCGGGFCQVADRKSCTSTIWLDVYADDAETCYETVTAETMENLCSQDYFVYAGHMDGNCGCINDASVNCTLSAYQQGDYNSTIYAITTTTTTTQAGRRRRNQQQARVIDQAANQKRSFHHAAGKKHFSRHVSGGKRTPHSFHTVADKTVALNQIVDLAATTYQVASGSAQGSSLLV